MTDAMRHDAGLLVRSLAKPLSTTKLDANGWTALLTIARSELLLGSLAYRLEGLKVPLGVAAILADARGEADLQRRQALWEAEMARRALAPLGVAIVLLKGTAFAAAGLAAGVGRHIGDLDILVPRDRLSEVQRALVAAGWDWVKDDPYDQSYYRRWMHELPPLIHAERDRMIDVHHTILPLTARPKPDAALLIAERSDLGKGLATLGREDMIVHAAAHLFADGDLAGGLRNLWDIDRLLREFGEADAEFADRLLQRAAHHQLVSAVRRSLTLAHVLFGTPVPDRFKRPTRSDRLFIRRLLARDGWGRRTRPMTRLGFYMRSHRLRMPPAMLARHLWIKWRRGSGG